MTVDFVWDRERFGSLKRFDKIGAVVSTARQDNLRGIQKQQKRVEDSESQLRRPLSINVVPKNKCAAISDQHRGLPVHKADNESLRNAQKWKTLGQPMVSSMTTALTLP